MERLGRAITICRSAEQGIRQLMQEAVTAGSYGELGALVRVAEQISQMSARLGSNHLPTDSNTVPGEPATAPIRRGPGTPRQQSRFRSTALHPKGEYPKFHRDGDWLVKIGWSKKEKKEYEHRASFSAAAALLKRIGGWDAKKGPFTVEGILPVIDPSDRSEVAVYQVYLCLAWFRREGVIRQHGRKEGYSLTIGENLDKWLEERSRALENH